MSNVWTLTKMRVRLALRNRAFFFFSILMPLIFLFGAATFFGRGGSRQEIAYVLGAILTVSALSATASTGVTLLGVYSLGLGLPFLAAAIFTDALLRRRGELGKAGRLLRVGTGAVMIAMGAAMITGIMSTFSFWLLDAFPILARIG